MNLIPYSELTERETSLILEDWLNKGDISGYYVGPVLVIDHPWKSGYQVTLEIKPIFEVRDPELQYYISALYIGTKNTNTGSFNLASDNVTRYSTMKKLKDFVNGKTAVCE